MMERYGGKRVREMRLRREVGKKNTRIWWDVEVGKKGVEGGGGGWRKRGQIVED